MRIEYYTEELAKNTNSKLIKNAFMKGELVVLLFVRDNCFYIEKSPNDRVTELTRKEMKKLWPNCREV